MLVTLLLSKAAGIVCWDVLPIGLPRLRPGRGFTIIGGGVASALAPPIPLLRRALPVILLIKSSTY